jgi:hypothetical protein
MLQDPEENIEDVSITIYADSSDEAMAQGEREAARRSDSDTIVVCLGCIKMTRSSGRYACTLRVETRVVNDER